MIACVDVDYRAAEVVAACVGIRDWADRTPCIERVVRTNEPAAPYVPGQFYLREMPWVIGVLERIADVQLVLIDGYVWLAKDRPGLGVHIYESLGRRCPVAGIAKGAFRNNDCAIPVVRGGSTRPLYVTAVGIDVDAVAAGIARMAGQHRIPTILKRVDRLARDS
jgi:deoxyribonuclease V